MLLCSTIDVYLDLCYIYIPLHYLCLNTVLMCLTEMVQAELAETSFCLPEQYLLYCYTLDLCICMVVSFSC